MLGLTTTPRGGWFASGKHPCAGDFFSAGTSFPLAASLSRWVEAGFAGELARRSAAAAISWRFWAGGGEVVAFGRVATSCDSVGRPYPLLVMGQEGAKGWPECWDRLPLALKPVWDSMDRLGHGQFQDLAALQERLCSLDRAAFPVLGGLQRDGCAGELAERDLLADAALATDCGVVSLSLSREEYREEGALTRMHAAVKRKLAGTPSAVFAGGLEEQPQLHFFYRPLAWSDFPRLWRTGMGAENGAT